MKSQDEYVVEYAGDVVEFLTEQHAQLSALMSRVLGAAGEERRALLTEVRGLLARHEAAEKAALRPLTRSAPGGGQQAASRTAEEERAERGLEFIASLDVDSPAFEVQYREISEAVLAHANKEETEEFPLLRRTYDPQTLRAARRTAEQREDGGPRPAERSGSLLHKVRQLLTGR